MGKVLFVGGTYIKPRGSEEPKWSEYHKQWHCAGYRWIKSKKHWSSSCLLHGFQAFEWVEESAIEAP